MPIDPWNPTDDRSLPTSGRWCFGRCESADSEYVVRGTREHRTVYVSDCQTRAIPRETGRRLLWVSLLLAAAIIVSAWLRSSGSLPGIDVAVMVAAALVGGWTLNRRSRVRGLPLVAGAVMSAVALGDATLGASAHAVSGGAMFMALLLSASARSWGSGLAAIAILAAAVFLTWLI